MKWTENIYCQIKYNGDKTNSYAIVILIKHNNN